VKGNISVNFNQILIKSNENIPVRTRGIGCWNKVDVEPVTEIGKSPKTFKENNCVARFEVIS
jgi:hypothetical protein